MREHYSALWDAIRGAIGVAVSALVVEALDPQSPLAYFAVVVGAVVAGTATWLLTEFFLATPRFCLDWSVDDAPAGSSTPTSPFLDARRPPGNILLRVDCTFRAGLLWGWVCRRLARDMSVWQVVEFASAGVLKVKYEWKAAIRKNREHDKAADLWRYHIGMAFDKGQLQQCSWRIRPAAAWTGRITAPVTTRVVVDSGHAVVSRTDRVRCRTLRGLVRVDSPLESLTIVR